jgi:hypothetical protein
MLHFSFFGFLIATFFVVAYALHLPPSSPHIGGPAFRYLPAEHFLCWSWSATRQNVLHLL